MKCKLKQKSPTPSGGNDHPKGLGHMIHLGTLRVCNVAVLIHSLGGTKTKDTTSSCHPRLPWKKHGTIEMWLPREPEMGGAVVSSRKSRYPRVSHYSGPRPLSRPVPVSSPGVPAPRRRYPKPEPQRESPVSGVGSGRVGMRGGRPGVRARVAWGAHPSPAPPCR